MVRLISLRIKWKISVSCTTQLTRENQKMHAAEFKTLREALGLSISTLVKVIDVDERTIRKWEAGKKKLPQGVVDSLIEIDALVNKKVTQAYQGFKQSAQTTVVLYRFIEEEDLHAHHPEFESLPMMTFGVVLQRLKLKLESEHVEVTIEYYQDE
ncbi:DUF1870 family protein [Marinicellulosiphila megalodicopiae]|uniref:Aca2/YdiL-like domain-containing protein n=1 Tax=Marinicellulosiphila megalodicopiae TaxID=2724896 RepID=UPI003BB0BC65